MAAKVYFLDDRSNSGPTSLVSKMLAVFDAAGLDQIVKPGDLVAIKVHCGEYNNTAYLRPVYARALADRVKSLGGRPFVCDTTTMYYGSRATALDELLTAERNGLTSATLGCPFIVADGFHGTDDLRIDLPEGFILREAYVAKAIALADVLIALTHFKGHGAGVYGGAIKNLGIGCQSKRGKHNVHLGGHPRYGWAVGASAYFPQRCGGRECERWQSCESACPWGLIHVGQSGIEIELERCSGCSSCAGLISCGVLQYPEDHYDAFCTAIADGALGVVKAVGREKVGFVNMAIDVVPACDCASFSDRPVVPNLGVFASRDPVAVDQACLDRLNATPGIAGSRAEEMGVARPGLPKLPAVAAAVGSSQELQLTAGAFNGLGEREYELVALEPPTQVSMPFDARRPREKFAELVRRDEICPPGGFRRLPEVDLSRMR